MSFTDKVVIVTGAASGIGAATAESFAKEGAIVVAVDINEDKLLTVTERIIKNNFRIYQIVANVANDDDVQGIIEKAINKFSKINILVNCAGVLIFGNILNGVLMNTYDELMKVNLRAVIKMTESAAPHLVKTKGNIVNIASVGGIAVNSSGNAAYYTSKAGVIHFTRASALELGKVGVRVNSVSPASTNTDMLFNSERAFDRNMLINCNALKRITEPEEIAYTVLYLAGDKAVGITGSNFVIDNGKLLM